MSTVEKSIRLYAWKTNYQTFQVVQGESNSRKFNIQLFSTTIPVDLTNCEVMFYAVKPDSTKVYVRCEVIDAENGLASVILTDQMCAVDGTVNCWVQVIDKGGTDLRFEGMNIEVSPCPMTTSIESSDDMQAFLQQAAKLAEIETEVKNARMGKENLRDKQASQDEALTDKAAAIKQEITVERIRIDNIVSQSNIAGIQRKLLVFNEMQISNKNEKWMLAWNGTTDLNPIRTKHPFVIDAYLRKTGSSDVGISLDTRYHYSIDMSNPTNLTIHITFFNNDVAAEGEAEKTYNVEACMILGYDCDIPEDDSEITDLRIDVNGKTHESAGSAVRAQIRHIRDNALCLDNTLTEEGKAAPAKSVGQLKRNIVSLLTQVRDALKGDDVDEAINLLDSFILNEGELG